MIKAPLLLTFAAIIALLITGCSARQDEPKLKPGFVKMQAPFDYRDHEPYARKGENGITGQGLVHRQETVLTCAGSRVLLLPGTAYFREMIGHIVAGSEPEPPETPYPSLKGMIRRTQCDAKGYFRFSEVPAGEWFVLTQVNTPRSTVLIQEVTISDGTTPQVLLTDRDIVVGR
jgi:hypothetical protein